MTLAEAIDKKISRVTTKPWNEYAHVMLPDFHGPWARLVDPCSSLAFGKPADHSDTIVMLRLENQTSLDPDQDIWEEWIMPPDYEERFGKPPDYKEAFTR